MNTSTRWEVAGLEPSGKEDVVREAVGYCIARHMDYRAMTEEVEPRWEQWSRGTRVVTMSASSLFNNIDLLLEHYFGDYVSGDSCV